MYDSPQVEREHIDRLHQREGVFSCSKARYYNANIGKFVSEDYLRFHAGVNFYPYAVNDPVYNIDPLGLDAITSDPNVLACFRDMWMSAGLGTRKYEVGAWINPSKNPNLKCDLCIQNKTFEEGQITVDYYPKNPIAFAHTHPTRYTDTNGMTSAPEPSDKDRAWGNVHHVNIYTISEKGIWKFDRFTQQSTPEEGPDWSKRAAKKCNEAKSCP